MTYSRTLHLRTPAGGKRKKESRSFPPDRAYRPHETALRMLYGPGAVERAERMQRQMDNLAESTPETG